MKAAFAFAAFLAASSPAIPGLPANESDAVKEVILYGVSAAKCPELGIDPKRAVKGVARQFRMNLRGPALAISEPILAEIADSYIADFQSGRLKCSDIHRRGVANGILDGA